ncbi:hypothetical protein [Flavobacterium sp.]|uniref:hypothetical protein n=1 Tax=Flavobacterium sp. TaxID=239 RepID=UPI0026316782|nr:hypothetical protein [Flavobacterium sp.]
MNRNNNEIIKSNLDNLKLDKDNKTITKNLIYSKTSHNLLMLFSMIILLIGLYQATISETFTNDIIIGIGIITSGYGFMKLSNK